MRARKPGSRRSKRSRNSKPNVQREAKIAWELAELEEQRREAALEREARIAEQMEQLRIQEETTRRLRTEEGGVRFRLPRKGDSLAEQLAKPRRGVMTGASVLISMALQCRGQWTDRPPRLGPADRAEDLVREEGTAHV